MTSPSKMIDGRIEALGDWRGETLARIRAIIKSVDPDVVETWKWRGVPVWEHEGMICTGETHKSVVKMTFAKGAFLEDPSRLFNSSLEGNVRRAIDVREGEALDEKALKALVRAAIALNTSKPAKQSVAKKKSSAKKSPAKKPSAKKHHGKSVSTKRPGANAKKVTARKAPATKKSRAKG